MPPPRKTEILSKSASSRLTASFRDPSGFLFQRKGTLYRQVNEVYRSHFDALASSGLYRELVDAGLLVAHDEAPLELAASAGAYKVIRPERVDFISYPYEWCFSELKDAALATLDVQKRALERGMVLKDATAYNIQFRTAKPVLIDTLSFETYEEGEPWIAYRQFCQHFVAPLAIASRIDARLQSLARTHVDGVPLDLASRMLPGSTWLRPSMLVHIHLHAKSGKAVGEGSKVHAKARVSKRGLLALVDSLESAVRSLTPRGSSKHWSSYYASEHRYVERAFAHKKETVAKLVERIAPKMVWDLGANTGRFSEICAERGIDTVAFDQDHDAVEAAYGRVRTPEASRFLPLVLDLSNPSPGIGWAHRERSSLAERGPVDLVLALALVHHLAIANNVPLADVASFFAELGRSLVIEFVPKEDEQVKRLLASRADIFDDYDEAGFERAFGQYFTIDERIPIEESLRTLYWMRAR